MNIALKRHGQVILWIAGFLAVSWGIGQFTRDDVDTWYRGLLKPDLNPPDLVFPIVWTTLYVLMAISGWILWNRRHHPEGKLCLTLFVMQTLINWAWSFLFFELHLLGFSFAWILGLILLMAVLILKSWTHARTASLLLFPTLLWISFASYLNGSIWLLN